MFSLPLPHPTMPDGKDITDKGNKAGDLIAGLSPAAWKIIVCIVAALIIMWLLKNPIVRGIVLGAALVGVVYFYSTN